VPLIRPELVCACKLIPQQIISRKSAQILAGGDDFDDWLVLRITVASYE
jgi:hypothetical protein